MEVLGRRLYPHPHLSPSQTCNPARDGGQASGMLIQHHSPCPLLLQCAPAEYEIQVGRIHGWAGVGLVLIVPGAHTYQHLTTWREHKLLVSYGWHVRLIQGKWTGPPSSIRRSTLRVYAKSYLAARRERVTCVHTKSGELIVDERAGGGVIGRREGR